MIWQRRSHADQIQAITRKAFGETIGVAQTPGQVGARRPALATPISGLWLVGADAGARGIGTEMAAASALALMDEISIDI